MIRQLTIPIAMENVAFDFQRAHHRASITSSPHKTANKQIID